jgi:hypothetical protein
MVSAGARADEAAPFGIAFDGYLAPTWDHSVNNQQTHQPESASRSKVGFTTMLTFDELAVGGVVDGMPGMSGEGRLTVGGVVGWQPRIGAHRYQLLGELGAERFSDVGGTALSTPSVGETWLDYVGARLGMTESFSSDSNLVLGAWLFVRKDLGEANVSTTQAGMGFGESTTTPYLVGGYSAGVAFRVGLRFEHGRTGSDLPTELTGI